MNQLKIKAKPVEGFTVTPVGGETLVFLARGEWNGLQEYRCVQPPALSGQMLIVNHEGGAFGAAVEKIFRTESEMVIVKASPDLITLLSEVAQ
jgi:hypothetical protein